MMHVSTMILSYSALLCGSLLAITLWVVTATKQKNFSPITYNSNHIFYSLFHKEYEKLIKDNLYSNSKKSLYFINFRKWQLINDLDNSSYRIISFGFPLLTIGILSGAVWANEAWGSYWNWDPKETWALITWLVYAGYLHMRITRGWRGRRAAYFAILGFAVVMFTFFGVTYLLPGLHAYA